MKIKQIILASLTAFIASASVYAEDPIVSDPSEVDKNMINDMLRFSQIETDFLLLLIIGFKHTWIGPQRKHKLLKKELLLDFSHIPYQKKILINKP